MTPEQIKAICHELGDLFGHKKLAECAGVSASVWSDYCNYEKPDTTIPLGRMFRVQDRLKRRDFSAAIIEHDRTFSHEATDPRLPAAQTMLALGNVAMKIAQILADEQVTPAEKREAMEEMARFTSTAAEMGASIASLPTGRVLLRAVS